MTYTVITAQRFRREAGSLAKKIVRELGLIQAEYETIVVSGTTVIDLSGAGVMEHVFIADRPYTLTAAYLVFTEATSADAGSNVSVGKVFVGTDDVDFFVTAVASVASQETGDRQSLTLVQTAVAEGDIITITSAGGKTGTGEGLLQLCLTRA